MRRRNMYYATGMPGWMRFGYSPGWGGTPPGAQYLMTGQWPTPQAQQAWEAMQAGEVPTSPMPGAWPYGAAVGGPVVDPQMEKQFIAGQLAMITDQLGMLAERLEAITSEPETESEE